MAGLGPSPKRKRPGQYLPPRRRAPRITVDLPLPPTVRVGVTSFGAPSHEFLQADGRWVICGGRGRCRECIRQDAAKSVEQRAREALAVSLGEIDWEAEEPVDIADVLTGEFGRWIEELPRGSSFQDWLAAVETELAR